jgi:hypothetical protein
MESHFARIKTKATKNNAIQPITAGLAKALARDGPERNGPEAALW